MNYEQRAAAVFDWLYQSDTAILGSYQEPDHLSDAALIDEVNTLVEEINALIPKQVTPDSLPIVLKEAKACLRRRHGARNWPPSKVLQAAITDAVQNKAKAISGEASAKLDLSPDAIAARRIRTGQPVAERWLYGHSADRLLEKGLIALSDLEGHRISHRQELVGLYGEERASDRIAELGGNPDAPNTDVSDFNGYQPKRFGGASY